MKISLDKIGAPVAFVAIGAVLAIVGAIGVVPIGDPYPAIDPVVKIIIIVLGIVLIILGPVIVVRELVKSSSGRVELSQDDLAHLTTNIALLLQKQINLYDGDKPMPRALSLFEERKTHFEEEKLFLADHFVPHLLTRCKNLSQQVFLIN